MPFYCKALFLRSRPSWLFNTYLKVLFVKELLSLNRHRFETADPTDSPCSVTRWAALLVHHRLGTAWRARLFIRFVIFVHFCLEYFCYCSWLEKNRAVSRKDILSSSWVTVRVRVCWLGKRRQQSYHLSWFERCPLLRNVWNERILKVSMFGVIKLNLSGY